MIPISYWDTANLSDDPDFRQRCTAALATEQHPAPEQTAYAWRWQYAGQPGFGDAYAYAVATGVENPGRDESVITDAQILSATQVLMTPPPEPPEVNPNGTWTRFGFLGWLSSHGVDVSDNVWTQNLSNEELLNMTRDLLDVP